MSCEFNIELNDSEVAILREALARDATEGGATYIKQNMIEVGTGILKARGIKGMPKSLNVDYITPDCNIYTLYFVQ